MNTEPSKKVHASDLLLHLGPFKYLIRAYDSWGVQLLDEIAKHLHIPERNGTPDRIIHLVRIKEAGHAADPKQSLPTRILRYLPGDEIQSAWKPQRNRISTVWRSSHSRHVFWTDSSTAATGPIRFHLPWGLIISDLADHGGGLLHCGLACHRDSGVLFLAPPSGGKSTTLSTAPPDWQVLSDDAAMIWRDKAGTWYASPMPSWGNMIRLCDDWQYSDLATGEYCRLRNLLLINKDDSIALQKLSPPESLPSLYRSFCEYPATITAEAIQHETFFRSAANITRELPCWRLSLPLHGNIWPLLAKEAA